MINENELLAKVEPLKRAAKIPPIVETGRYTMVIPYVEFLRIVKDLSKGGDAVDKGTETKA